MNQLLDAAHDYRSRGWRPIALHRVGPDGVTCSCRQGARCTSAGKHPMNNAWQNSPAPSAPDVQATWDVAKPPNVGIAVGPVSGVWVLDIDPKNGGFESMQALVAQHGPLPTTFVTQTGSGGYHYYFRIPEDVELRNTADQVGRGIDTRAEGGQVVAAPSHSSIGTYQVVQDVAPALAPAWLIEAARRAVSDAPVVTAADLPRPEDIAPEEWDRLNGYAAKAVKGNLARLEAMSKSKTPDPSTYRGEPWNHTTFEVSCALLELANSPWCSYASAEADVMRLAPRDQDFTDDVVSKTFASARERVGDKARPVPEQRRSDPLLEGVRDLTPRREPGTSPPPTPTAGGEAHSAEAHSADDFFDKKDLQVATLAQAIMNQGPLAWGRDEAFWTFDNGVWTSNPEVVRNRSVDLLGQRYRNSHADNVSTVVKRHAIQIKAAPHPRWINFQNGMLDWRTGHMTAHDPLIESTVQLPLDWEPSATCPTFEAFLADVMHEDYLQMVWEMIGYLMYSGNPLQVAYLFYGSGGNGKGTLMRVIQDLLGHHNVSNESLDDLNGNRFSAVNLFGKIANIAGDIDGTYQESTAPFKKLTGEDTIAAERKFGQRFNFQSWAVPVFSANKIPGSADVTEGYLRRWVVIHFHKRILNMIPGFSDLLTSELPGIAARGVRALRDLMEREAFEPRGEAVKGAEEFAIHIDQVRQWVHSGEVVNKEDAWVPLELLYGRYCSWVGRTGSGRLKESEFSARLHAIGFIRDAEHGSTRHRGIVPHHAPATAAAF